MINKFLGVSIPVLLLVGAAFYFTYKLIDPGAKKELIIATGSKSGQYYQTALKYKDLLEKEGIKVSLINSKGSIENIKLLEEKKVDVAFVQNGTINKNTNLQALASIYYEPLWIFYNTKLKKVENIKDFKHKKISIGDIGSGTHDLSLKLLELNGINKNNSKIFDYDINKAKKLLTQNKLDVLFLVASSKSQNIKELLNNNKIDILSFNRAKAYSSNFNFLNSIDLYEGIIDLKNDIPKVDKSMISTTATLIAKNDLHDELTRLLLKKVKIVHNKKSLFTNENEFPNISNLDIQINEEAQRYFKYGDTFLEKIFPFWIASNLDRLKILLIPLLTLLFPLFKGALPLYRWSIRSKIYTWYDKVQKHDLSLENLKKEELKEKLNQLEELKKEIKAETKVPLSYMGEYYDLIMHIELIISKINLKIK